MQAPVRVTKEQLAVEVAAVTGALQSVCPLQLTLDRVIVNRGGVVMACWQVSRGSTTAAVRDALQVRLVSQWVQAPGWSWDIVSACSLHGNRPAHRNATT